MKEIWESTWERFGRDCIAHLVYGFKSCWDFSNSCFYGLDMLVVNLDQDLSTLVGFMKIRGDSSVVTFVDLV